jgi:diguanylate cyclase (GGDEF)-like protein
LIDIQTFMLALGVGNTAFALLMAAYTHGVDNRPDLRYWMWARLLGGLAQTAWWAAPYLRMPAVEGAAVFAWIAAVVLEVGAYCLFFGQGHWRRVMVASALGSAIALAAGVACGASRLHMTWIVAGINALFASGAAFMLLRVPKAPLLQRIIGVNDGLFALAIWGWLIIDQGRIVATVTPVGALAYLFSYLMMIVNGFGFLLLCKQKDDARMRILATVDGLTETLNRRAFFERADSARQLALRLRKPIALLMLDLDHFKQLNDSYGHACGDDALRMFAATAHGMLREHDLLGRLGGEEFALALPGTSLEGARQAAERLRIAIMEAPLLHCAADYRMTVSIGVVMIEPDETLTAALARADYALYAAKTGGRNRVETGPAMLRRVG